MSVQHSEPGNYFTPAEGNKDFLPRESPLDSRRLSTEHYSLITAHRGKTLETDRAPPPAPAEQEVNGLFLSCLKNQSSGSVSLLFRYISIPKLQKRSEPTICSVIMLKVKTVAGLPFKAVSSCTARRESFVKTKSCAEKTPGLVLFHCRQHQTHSCVCFQCKLMRLIFTHHLSSLRITLDEIQS